MYVASQSVQHSRGAIARQHAHTAPTAPNPTNKTSFNPDMTSAKALEPQLDPVGVKLSEQLSRF